MNKIDKFIEQQKDFVLRVFKEQDELQPILCFLTEKEDKLGVSYCPIPTELMNDTGKDIIRYQLIETLKDRIKKEGHKLLCVNWNSEGWMYKGNKEELQEVDGYYRHLPRTEVLLMTFDSEDNSQIVTYEIKRNMSVGVNGLNNEVNVELIQLDKTSTSKGRFTEMFD